ncbi:MAG: PleD family two-component system response regulator [Myxococcota bacterium]|nr:response regulator [Myxococcota bacterium]
MPYQLLLADDSATMHRVVQIVFANEDFQVTAVDNGQAAVATAKSLKPQLALVDVGMPGMDGYAVCQAIKADADTSGIPVVLLASNFQPIDEARAQSVGATAHVMKPFESQALLDRVKTILGAPVQAAIRSIPQAGAPTSAPPVAAKPAAPPAAAPAASGGFGAPMGGPARPQVAPTAAPAGAPPGIPAQRPAAPPTSPFTPPPRAPGQPPASPFAAGTPAGQPPPQRTPPAQPPMAPAQQARPAGPPPPPQGAPTTMPRSPFGTGPATPPAAPPQRPAAPPQAPVQARQSEGLGSLEMDFGGLADSPPPRPAAPPAVPPRPTPPPAAAASITSPLPQTASRDPFGLGQARPQQPMQAQAPAAGAQARAGLPPELAGMSDDVIKAVAREVIERIAWEIVPELAESIVRAHLDKLLKDQGR